MVTIQLSLTKSMHSLKPVLKLQCIKILKVMSDTIFSLGS